MRGGAGDNFMGFVYEASGFKKVYSIEGARATIALVSSSILQHLIKVISNGHIGLLTGKLQCGHMPSTYRSAKNLGLG